MRHVWALPALLRAAAAGKNTFSVNEDLLAHPQYEIKFPQDWISEQRAQSLLGEASLNHDIEESTSFALQKQDPSSQWTPQGQPDAAAAHYQYESLIMKEQRYLCSIPTVDQTATEAENVTLSRRDEEKELMRANDHGWELLQEMQGSCIYYWSGWWSYRYCYNQGVKQFHQLPPQPGMALHPPVEDPSVPGFDLGTMDGTLKADDIAEGKDIDRRVTSLAAAKQVGALETRGEMRYLVQRLEGGTVCDLTGKERKIDIQFHCSPSTNDHIAVIKELATCTYLMVINTPRLCSDAAFLPPSRDHSYHVSCSPVLKPDEVAAYKAKIAARAKKTIEQEVPNLLKDKTLSPSPSRLGDVIVGAHKWVPEGREIEKTGIIGGKEILIDVIANSKGKSLSNEEMKRLGITSTKQIDELKKKLDQIAGDNGWSIEMVDTPRGREFRGMLGDTEQDTKETGSTSKNQAGREEYEKNKFEAAKKKAGKEKSGEKSGLTASDEAMIKERAKKSGLSESDETKILEQTKKIQARVEEKLSQNRERREKQKKDDEDSDKEELSELERAVNEAIDGLEDLGDMFLFLQDGDEFEGDR